MSEYYLIVGAPETRQVFVYDINTYRLLQVLNKPEEDSFGYSLSIEGHRVGISSKLWNGKYGAMHIYDNRWGYLEPISITIPSFDVGPGFGHSSVIFDKYIIVGNLGYPEVGENMTVGHVFTTGNTIYVCH